MPPDAEFHPTHWSLIAALRAGEAALAEQAMETLCQAYWYPLYAYVRRLGHPQEDAADLTQGFFLHLVEHRVLEGANPGRGRLRNLLLTAMQRFLRDDWRKQQRLKRGSGHRALSIDEVTAEGQYAREPASAETPESLYHRRWALTLLERTLTGLRDDYARQGKADLFEALKPTLTEDPDADSAGRTGEILGMAAGAVRVAVCRLRARYRARLLAEVAASMETPTEAAVNEEIDALFRALG